MVSLVLNEHEVATTISKYSGFRYRLACSINILEVLILVLFETLQSHYL